MKELQGLSSRQGCGCAKRAQMGAGLELEMQQETFHCPSDDSQTCSVLERLDLALEEILLYHKVLY